MSPEMTGTAMSDRAKEQRLPDGKRNGLRNRNGHASPERSRPGARPWITKRRVLITLFAALLSAVGYGLFLRA